MRVKTRALQNLAAPSAISSTAASTDTRTAASSAAKAPEKAAAAKKTTVTRARSLCGAQGTYDGANRA